MNVNYGNLVLLYELELELARFPKPLPELDWESALHPVIDRLCPGCGFQIEGEAHRKLCKRCRSLANQERIRGYWKRSR